MIGQVANIALLCTARVAWAGALGCWMSESDQSTIRDHIATRIKLIFLSPRPPKADACEHPVRLRVDGGGWWVDGFSTCGQHAGAEGLVDLVARTNQAWIAGLALLARAQCNEVHEALADGSCVRGVRCVLVERPLSLARNAKRCRKSRAKRRRRDRRAELVVTIEGLRDEHAGGVGCAVGFAQIADMAMRD